MKLKILMKKIFFFLSFLIFLFSPQIIKSQEQNITNCDACGYCLGSSPPSYWEKCVRCIYPRIPSPYNPYENKTLINFPTPDPDRYYTVLGCISTQPAEFTRQLSDFFFRISGGVAFLFLLYGAGLILTSQADVQRLNQGKRIVYASLLALLFILFSVFIFNFIANNVLKIPLNPSSL